MNKAAACVATVGMVLGVSVDVRTSQGIDTQGGIYTTEQAQRGGVLYEPYCASCHGAALTGGELAPALTGPEFASNWDGVTIEQLFLRVYRDMPQNSPGVLTAENAVDIIAYMLKANGYPTGKVPLSHQRTILATIVIGRGKGGGL